MNPYFEIFCRHWNSYGLKFEFIATHDEYVFMNFNNGNGFIFSELFKYKSPEEPQYWYIRSHNNEFKELTIKYNIDYQTNLIKTYWAI